MSSKRRVWVFKIIFILVASYFAYAGYLSYKQLQEIKTGNAHLTRAAENVRQAERQYFAKYGSYTNDLALLKKLEPAIAEHDDVKYVFFHASQSGYTFSVEDRGGSNPKWLYSDKD